MVEKESPADTVEPGLSCPRCHMVQIAELPANGITPHPGYRCLSCGTRLRGMTATYAFVIVVGVALIAVSAGVVPIFGDDRDARLRGFLSPYLIPLYFIAIAYAVREVLRPRPRRTLTRR
ncbi:MAG: hypothetical protein LC104_17775 [Bacteroidales bacterium]|nr:hypothetical protein [Bacteroidales bacterium]